MAERSPDFQFQEIKELKDNSENQKEKKYIDSAKLCTSFAKSKDFESNLLAYEGETKTGRTFSGSIRDVWKLY